MAALTKIVGVILTLDPSKPIQQKDWNDFEDAVFEIPNAKTIEGPYWGGTWAVTFELPDGEDFLQFLDHCHNSLRKTAERFMP